VYNDDVPLSNTPLSRCAFSPPCRRAVCTQPPTSPFPFCCPCRVAPYDYSPELYTTWKSRTKKGKEVVTKRSIDYIFYTPYVQGQRKEPERSATNGGTGGTGGAAADGSSSSSNVSEEDDEVALVPVVAYSRSQMVTSALLRFIVLSLFSVVPAAAIISSGLELSEKAIVLALSFLSLRIFEVAAEGTIFKPQIAGPLASSRFIGMSDEKLAEKKNAEKLIRASVGALSSYFIPKPRPTSDEARPVR
jgi:hypothetical protein